MARLQTIPSRLGKLPPKRQVAPSNTESWRAGKTSAQRGYGYKWQQARAGYLAKHPHCVMCLGELGMMDMQPADVVVECARRGLPVPVATVVDHIEPHQGDQRLFWDRSNWQSLCKTHHDGHKQRIERGSERQRGCSAGRWRR